MQYRRAPIGVDLLDDAGNFVRNIRRRQQDAKDWEEWQAHIDADGPVLPMPADPAPPTEADAEYKRAARVKIDGAAALARMRYITSLPGQDVTYLAKYQDAKAYIAAGPLAQLGDYPWIQAEAQATGQSAPATATRIKTAGDLWHNVKGPAIEAIRVARKDAVSAATLRTEVDSELANARAALAAT